ncbi:hypothetical protein BDK51DRAFT_35252 [Blyttiomyces helicus]|uniref:Uncharacterized protein n=1 Tax=Blyttiomyces helicus TaxID=388810 RepID=A0A4P9WIB9_9FUNG|nr:hypothetical protein BDK51DRAFT_35252 [Blyttiomyces helicus]|eukprot:RKO92162.1 hypothetical protein BDK51DRAFT_35252 [Blyttiomyces helicus]
MGDQNTDPRLGGMPHRGVNLGASIFPVQQSAHKYPSVTPSGLVVPMTVSAFFICNGWWLGGAYDLSCWTPPNQELTSHLEDQGRQPAIVVPEQASIMQQNRVLVEQQRAILELLDKLVNLPLRLPRRTRRSSTNSLTPIKYHIAKELIELNKLDRRNLQGMWKSISLILTRGRKSDIKGGSQLRLDLNQLKEKGQAASSGTLKENYCGLQREVSGVCLKFIGKKKTAWPVNMKRDKMRRMDENHYLTELNDNRLFSRLVDGDKIRCRYYARCAGRTQKEAAPIHSYLERPLLPDPHVRSLRLSIAPFNHPCNRAPVGSFTKMLSLLFSLKSPPSPTRKAGTECPTNMRLDWNPQAAMLDTARSVWNNNTWEDVEEGGSGRPVGRGYARAGEWGRCCRVQRLYVSKDLPLLSMFARSWGGATRKDVWRRWQHLALPRMQPGTAVVRRFHSHQNVRQCPKSGW